MGELDNNIPSIIQGLVKKYVEEFNNQPLFGGGICKCRNAYDIDNGFCNEFAEDFVKLLGGENDKQFILTSDMFLCDSYEDAVELWGKQDLIETNSGGAWSRRMLLLYSTPYIKNIGLVEDLPQHAWVFVNSKHYDAERPNGVKSPWKLLIFRNFFKRLL